MARVGRQSARSSARTTSAVKAPGKKRKADAASAKKDARKTSGAVTRAGDSPPAYKRGEVVIRMYRQGLGDCFMVFIPRADRSFFKLMIDCGAIVGQRKRDDGQSGIAVAIKSIIAATEGVVDVLAVTHEHWDHVSGFLDAEHLFCKHDEKPMAGKLKVGAVWFAWTEDETDATARILQNGLRALLEHAQAIGSGLEMRTDKALAVGGLSRKDLDRLGGLRRSYAEVLSFFGHDPETPISPAGVFSADGKTSKTRAAMQIAAQLSRDISYMDPKSANPWTSDSVPGVRVFALGPPRDPKALRKTEPGKEGFALETSGDIAAGAVRDALAETGPSDVPFDGVSLAEPGARNTFSGSLQEFFKRHYYDDVVEEGPEAGSPQGPVDQDWRRINHEWLASTSEFALALDGQTNNTSLVLAIELSPGGPVLLFVGDAQAGNWLSWHDLSWTIDGQRIDIRKLFSRVTFLKVGHHGSHNATLKGLGLELLTHPDIVAAVPVDRETARKKRWHEMPFAPIIEDLRRRTRNRVVLSEAPTAADFRGDGFEPGQLIETDNYFEFRRRMTFR